MTTPFPNPPITEAIFDIRVTLPKDTKLEKLLSFQELVSEEFPVKKDRHKWEGKFKFDLVNPSAGATTHEIDGYLFHAVNNQKIVQARLDGFTFNKLKPYTKWELFSSEAFSLWEKYVKIAEPVAITRLALRYINRIEIPLPFKDFSEYILTRPELGDGIPSGISDFLFRLVIPNAEVQAVAVITETIDKNNPVSDKLPLILDIDVFKDVNWPLDNKKIMETMEALRDFKNTVFLSSLTDRTKELFL